MGSTSGAAKGAGEDASDADATQEAPSTAEGAAEARAEVVEALKTLGLEAMPASVEDLNKAFRAAVVRAHPDKHGGTVLAKEEAQRVLAARGTIKRAMCAP